MLAMSANVMSQQIPDFSFSHSNQRLVWPHAMTRTNTYKLPGNLKFANRLVFKVMHDEVSETENIRKNLSIERQIAEGCEMLLDVNQIFIRQGNYLSLTLKNVTVKINVCPGNRCSNCFSIW